MASIANSTNSVSSIRGYGGLVSGLDRDTLIQGMTTATRAKIAKQQKQVQTYLWKQEAYRSISSKLVEFSQKYTSYANQSTNISSPSFWAKSSITALGENSKYINVSGSSSLADSMSIVGVKQMAKDSSMSSSGTVSDQSLTTGVINLGDEPVSNLEGQSLTFKYGSKTYSISLSSGTAKDGFTYDYSNGAKAQESITRALKNVSIGNGKTLADVIEVQAFNPSSPDQELSKDDPLGTEFKLNFKSKDEAGNSIWLTGGSEAALKALGLSDINSLTDNQKEISPGGLSSDLLSRNQTFFEPKTFAQRVADKSISFTYNGTTKSIQFGSEDMLNGADLNTIATDLEKKLGKAFGDGRIKVSAENGKLEFHTMNPATQKEDNSSILSISSADTGVIGKTGALKVEYGESNRLNLSSSLINSGLKGIESGIGSKLNNYETTYFSGSIKAMELIDKLGSKVTDSMDVDTLKQLISSNYSQLSDTVLSDVYGAIDHFKKEGATNVGELNEAMDKYVSDRELKLTINGTDIKGLTYNSTINDIINKVNSSDAGVTMSYMVNADKFSIVSTAGGAAGRVDFRVDPNNPDDTGDASLLFGTKDKDYTITEGQDAIIGVKYAGSDDVVELVRGNNSFNLDGLNITVNGTFGYNYVKDDSNGSYVKADDGSYLKVVDPKARYNDAGVKADDGEYVMAGDGKLVKVSNGLYSLADTPPVTFNAKTDSDKIVTAVSDMIKDYNEIIKLVNAELTTKPNRSYEPLTEEQKSQLTEDQINKWEEKAKAGMLFNDSDIRGISDSLRFIFESGSSDKAMLESFGISTSSSYGDNGKLVFDETKFRAALESNPEDLQRLFTKTADSVTGEKGGVMARITSVTEKYASTTGATKGILIEKAGSIYAPVSILNNAIQKSVDSINNYVSRLQDQLKTETDRYIKQFTSLESLISQMNSQSGWLSQFGS